VPAADLPRLFEPLYRADAARSRHRGGSGLGLAICDAIARSHGGGIEAGLSTLGGLRVRIELPLSAGAAA
jgi:two-component system, OmpR family, sensor histidine kinase BaeS